MPTGKPEKETKRKAYQSVLIHRGYKYELKPNNRQKTLLAKFVGCARFAYNWGLEQRITLLQTQKGRERFTNAIRQYHELVQLKRTEFTWLNEVSKWVPQEALRDLEKAFKNYWRGKKNGKNVGFPKFKRKGYHDSFRLYATIRVYRKTVQLPRLGQIRLKETPQIKGRILFATVSRKADRWFVSFNVEQVRSETLSVTGPTIGVDLGIVLATLSNGIVFENPRALSRRLRKLRRLSKQFSRKRRGSQNRQKAVIRLARLHWHISNIRKDSLHKVTSYLAKNHSQTVIEDLRVYEMLKNKPLSFFLADVSLSEFRRQLEYKTKWYGTELIVAPHFFPSSKRCSRCGNIKKTLLLSERLYNCEFCGLTLDRDLNAANNLVAASWAETVNACQEVGGYRSDGSVPTDETGTKHHQPS
ncbi:MAG: RNA-guided endonuclease InsQ/TnpB family protein [Promethearchaeota archaeon]